MALIEEAGSIDQAGRIGLGTGLADDRSAELRLGDVAAGQRTDVLFNSVDVMPTLLSLAGVSVPTGVQGQDLVREIPVEGLAITRRLGLATRRGHPLSPAAGRFVERLLSSRASEDQNIEDQNIEAS